MGTILSSYIIRIEKSLLLILNTHASCPSVTLKQTVYKFMATFQSHTKIKIFVIDFFLV